MIVGGALTDLSGSITTGGTRQSVTVVNNDRRYLLIQNPTTATESFWVNFGTNAVVGSPSIEVAIGAGFVWESGFVPTQSIDVIAATTGTKFTIKVGN